MVLRMQSAITLSRSEPEPDAALVRGNARTYAKHHPKPPDIGLVIEVSDSTLDGDRIDKGRLYAEAGIVCYWIVNLVDRQIEIYSVCPAKRVGGGRGVTPSGSAADSFVWG